jgi:hypothetical protein
MRRPAASPACDGLVLVISVDTIVPLSDRPRAPPRPTAHAFPNVGYGFLARMNALMNLPSTAGAIASALNPLSAKNARASSLL